MKRILVLVLVFLAGTIHAATIQFQDVTKQAGMEMKPRAKHPDKKIAKGKKNFENVYAKGYFLRVQDVCFVEINGDNKPDVFVLNNPHGNWSRLFIGDGKGGFREVNPKQFFPTPKRSYSAWRKYSRLMAYDFKGKGFQDIIMTEADKRYTSVQLECSVPNEKDLTKFRLNHVLTGTNGYTHLLSDFDNDHVVDYATGATWGRYGIDGDFGALKSGFMVQGHHELDRTNIPIYIGSYAVAADFDNDGLVDVLSRGFGRKSILYKNLGNRLFKDVSKNSGIKDLISGGPSAVADFNNDGLLDIYATGAKWEEERSKKPISGGVSLLINQGNLKFKDMTKTSGLIPKGKKKFLAKYGCVSIADFDNDGKLDIFVCDEKENRLFHNQGNGKFQEITEGSGIAKNAEPESNNDCNDMDMDGRIDLITVSPTKGLALYKNTTQNQNKWIKIDIRGTPGNPEGAGAKVSVYQAGKLGQQAALLGYQENLFGTEIRMPRPLHFGLGANAQCDIRVVFPGGKKKEVSGVNAGTIAVIKEQ